MAERLPGLFVTFEGGEGAGKTTQIALLREALTRDGLRVTVTREPGGDAVGEVLRELILRNRMAARTELLLFLAARAENVEQVIRPPLEAGGVVLCDRFTDSSLAYQSYGRGLDRDTVAQLNAFATGGLVPDVTLLLDLPPETGLARQPDSNRMEAETLEFHRRVREGFLTEAAKHPARFSILDALRPVETLHAEIAARVRAAWNERLSISEETESRE